MYSFHYIRFGTRGELWVLRQSADPQRVESKGADRQGADFREKVKVPIFEKKSRCRFSRKSQGADFREKVKVPTLQIVDPTTLEHSAR
jgi:hypothetical protein